MTARPLRHGRPCLQESQGRKEACQGLRICPHRKRDRYSDNVSQIYFLWQGRPFVKIYKHIIAQLANFVKLFITFYCKKRANKPSARKDLYFIRKLSSFRYKLPARRS